MLAVESNMAARKANMADLNAFALLLLPASALNKLQLMGSSFSFTSSSCLKYGPLDAPESSCQHRLDFRMSQRRLPRLS
jgi:hypothetical protein